MRRLLFLFIIILFLAGCAEKRKEGAPPLQILMEDYTGRLVSDYYASGPYDLVLLNYWATFCAPCKKEMVDLARLYDLYKDRNVLVLGAATDPADKRDLVEKISASLGVTYPILYGAEAAFNNEEIIGYPTTFFIKDGRVVEKIEGMRDYDFFAERIEHHLMSLAGPRENSESVVEKERYIFSYGVQPRADGTVLTVRLRPAEGYYLNGPGYPPLTVTIDPSGGLTAEPSTHTLEGIGRGQDEVMEFLLTGPIEEGTEAVCYLSLIACDDNTCSMINEEIDVTL